MKNLSNENVIHVKKENVEYIQFRRLLEYNNVLNHCYTLKNHDLDFSMHGETSKYKPIVIQNYKRICDAIGADYKQIVRPWQTHTGNIQKIKGKIKENEPDIGLEELKNIDGIMTNEKNIILSTINADCILFLFFDPIKRAIANVHSGWRGTFQKIAPKAVKEMMEEYGCDPKDILCCISPSISAEKFCVHEDVEKPCREIFAYTNRVDEFIRLGEIEEEKQKYYIDTIKINKIMLMELGIKEENIIESKICSVQNAKQIHSKRGSKTNFFGVGTALIELKE